MAVRAAEKSCLEFPSNSAEDKEWMNVTASSSPTDTPTVLFAYGRTPHSEGLTASPLTPMKGDESLSVLSLTHGTMMNL